MWLFFNKTLVFIMFTTLLLNQNFLFFILYSLKGKKFFFVKNTTGCQPVRGLVQNFIHWQGVFPNQRWTKPDTRHPQTRNQQCDYRRTTFCLLQTRSRGAIIRRRRRVNQPNSQKKIQKNEKIAMVRKLIN